METAFYTFCVYLPIRLLGVVWVVSLVIAVGGTAVARKCGGNTRFEPDGRVFHSSVYVRV